MENKQEYIINYLKEKYKPQTIALYGSYAEGRQDESSDFDCLLIVDKKQASHDHSRVRGLQLDCFIYTEEEIEKEETDKFLPLYEAKLLYDWGPGEALKKRVEDYVAAHAHTDPEEKDFLVSWIQKTLKRIEKGDDEGNFRAIAFLGESLEDYCRLRDLFYFGSKKTISYLKERDPAGFILFHRAITGRSNEEIVEWGRYIMA